MWHTLPLTNLEITTWMKISISGPLTWQCHSLSILKLNYLYPSIVVEDKCQLAYILGIFVLTITCFLFVHYSAWRNITKKIMNVHLVGSFLPGRHVGKGWDLMLHEKIRNTTISSTGWKWGQHVSFCWNFRSNFVWRTLPLRDYVTFVQEMLSTGDMSIN